MPFVSKKRSPRDLALDIILAPWRVEGAVALPGIVIAFLVALAIVFLLHWGRGDRLDAGVVTISIVGTLLIASALVVMLSIALAGSQWRATGGRSWSFVSDPACLAVAEKFARLYLTGERGEAYALLDPSVREQVTLEVFERRRRDFQEADVVEQVSVFAEEPDDWNPAEADGRLRGRVREGRPVAYVGVDLDWVAEGRRCFACVDLSLSSHGKKWFVADWEPLNERGR